MDNYPQYFPSEARANPREWLEKNWREWTDFEVNTNPEKSIRYGLLSGFPLDSALHYSDYHSGLQKLKNLRGQILSDEDITFIENYKDRTPKSVDNKQVSPDEEEIIRIMDKAKTNLTNEEQQALVGCRQVSSEHSKLAYFGFDQQKDHEYIQKLDAIYVQSAVEEQI